MDELSNSDTISSFGSRLKRNLKSSTYDDFVVDGGEKPHEVEFAHEDTIWLSETKDAVVNSFEWKSFRHRLNIEIQKKLEENHVQYFSDLTNEEKLILVEEAEAALKDTDCYKNYYDFLSTSLDDGILNSINKRAEQSKQSSRRNSTDENAKTKIEKIIEYASIGVAKLLHQVRSDKANISILLNQSLPQPLREQVWMMYLSNNEARFLYEKKFSAKPRNVISNSDTEITHKCKTVFESSYPEILSQNQNFLMVAKTVISYFHSSSISTEYINDGTAYLLVIPLVVVFGAEGYRKVSTVVEALATMLQMARSQLTLQGSDSKDVKKRHKLVEYINEELNAQNPDLYAHLCKVFGSSNAEESSNKKDDLIEEETSANINENTAKLKLRLKISEVIQPFLEQVFVGVLSLDTCLYVWDQCLLIGLQKIAPKFCIVIIHLLSNHLLKCESVKSISDAIKTHARTIEMPVLLREMEKKYMKDIRSEVGANLREMTQWNINKPMSKSEKQKQESIIKNEEETISKLQQEANQEEKIESAEEVKKRLERKIQEKETSNKKIQEEKIQENNVPEIKIRENNKQESKAVNAPGSPDKNSNLTEDNVKDKTKPSTVNEVVPAQVIEGVKIVEINLKWDKLSDTIQRCMVLNGKEEDEDFKAKVETILRKSISQFKSQDASDTEHLLVKLGDKTLVFRCLEHGDTKSSGRGIVETELNRMKVKVAKDRVDLIIEKLILHSKKQTNWKDPSVSLLENIVKATLLGLNNLATKT